MTTLHDRLAELADDVDSRDAAGAAALWARGRRCQRRRRAGTAVVVLVACLLLGATGWQVHDRSRADEVVLPAGSPAALPDRVWEPSGWLPGTDEVGPPGRVALTMTVDREGWWGSTPGIVAVSAETGRYTFLDLSSRAEGTDTALSPDGRYLAYWRSGTPSGSPPEDVDAVTGFAVYDATTGDIRSQEIESEHGLREESLVFADNATLVAAFYQRAGGRGDDPEDQATSFPAPLWRWNLAEEQAVPDAALTHLADGQFIDGGAYGHLWWAGDGGSTHEVMDVHHPDRGVRSIPVRSNGPLYTSAVDRSGRRVAAVPGSANPNHVVWGSETDPERPVPRSGRAFQVLAWLDDSQLVVLRTTTISNGLMDAAVWVLDIESSEAQQLVRPVRRDSALDRDEGSGPVLDCCSGRHIAWELAREPTFRAVQPPEPLDPRLVVGGTAVIVMAAAVALVALRRRVQR